MIQKSKVQEIKNRLEASKEYGWTDFEVRATVDIRYLLEQFDIYQSAIETAEDQINILFTKNETLKNSYEKLNETWLDVCAKLIRMEDKFVMLRRRLRDAEDVLKNISDTDFACSYDHHQTATEYFERHKE